MAVPFPVPDAYRDLEDLPPRRAWVDALPARAQRLAERWDLTPDGRTMFGFLSVVWPVRDRTGRRLALKIHDFSAGTDGERLALAAAPGPGLVELVASEPSENALLLERLDPTRTLLDVGLDEACGLIGDMVAHISAVEAPAGVRPMASFLDGVRAGLEHKRGEGLGRGDLPVPAVHVERALDTLASLAAELRATPGRLPLVHGDLHYENVLHTLPGEPPRWVAIDPLPMAGFPELDVVAALRNRWDDVVATGDAERALRRCFDVLCEHAALDRERARALLQAVAVDNVLWISRAEGLPPLVQSFLHPYSVVSRW